MKTVHPAEARPTTAPSHPHHHLVARLHAAVHRDPAPVVHTQVGFDRYDSSQDDETLFHKGYNRIYDTLEMEANLNYVESFTSKALDALGSSGAPLPRVTEATSTTISSSSPPTAS